MTEQDVKGTGKPSSGGGALSRVPGRAWIALVLFVLALVFIFQNRDDAKVSFLLVTVTAPMWIALLAGVALGVVIGVLGAGRRRKP